MNLASLLILAIIGICVWIAIHILRKNGGRTCDGCKSCNECCKCSKR